MKTQLTAGCLAVNANGTDLHLLMNRLIVASMPVAIRNESFIENNIPSGLFIQAEPDLTLSLNHIINQMMNSQHKCNINVFAKTKGANVVLFMEKATNGSSVVMEMRSSRSRTQKMRGYFRLVNSANTEDTSALPMTA